MLVYSILPLARRGRCAMLVSLIGARCGMPYAALPSSCSGAMYWMVLAALLVCVLGIAYHRPLCCSVVLVTVIFLA
jgi:hypothetical protein